TAAPSAPNRTPATAEREATAQAGSTAGQVERRAFQIPATVPPAPHPRSAGSTATDDLLEPAPRSSRSRTAHRSSHPNRASDVPHISSRSADYTPTPGPIERLFPHPVRRDHSAATFTPPDLSSCCLWGFFNLSAFYYLPPAMRNSADIGNSKSSPRRSRVEKNRTSRFSTSPVLGLRRAITSSPSSSDSCSG